MRKVYIFFICLLFALACTGGGGEKTDAQEGDLTQDAEEVSEVAESDAQKEKRRFVILHTNDLHSHLTGTGPENDFTPDKTGDDAVKGGFARIAAKIKEIRQSTSDPVLLG
ncbi:MAG: hypothetical protein FJ088_16265, partial [Deltaproteobacteria bacterium]|nr:hypothetical protein [Deltaproteobacteria bacterium]